MTRPTRILAALFALGLAASVAAQAAAGIDRARVREVLYHLASDAMAGRDTPSAGLDAAAAFLSQAFEAAGLTPGGDEGTFFHHYTKPGVAVDRRAVTVHATLEGRTVELEPLRDVRVWRAGAAFDQREVEVLRLDAADAGALARRLRGRKPVLLEIDEDDPLWRASGDPEYRAMVPRRNQPPWLLVRRGVLPPPPPPPPAAVEGEPPPPAAPVLLCDVVVPVEAVELRLRNVVALWPGEALADEVVLVTAHYDHVGVGTPVDGDAIYNGADDNGTGTTAVLALAEAVARAGAPLPRTVAFVCFSGEERGLLGSRAFAEAPPFPLERVAVNLNIEMLGRPWKPDTLWVTGRALSDFEAVVVAGAAAAGVEVAAFPQEAMLFRASDNWPFVQKGIVAHSVSASSLHADYHWPSDEPDRIDVDNMTRLLRGLHGVLVELATRPERLAYNEDGQQLLEGGRRRR